MKGPTNRLLYGIIDEGSYERDRNVLATREAQNEFVQQQAKLRSSRLGVTKEGFAAALLLGVEMETSAAVGMNQAIKQLSGKGINGDALRATGIPPSKCRLAVSARERRPSCWSIRWSARMARELADEPHGSGAAIVVSDGHRELFEVALADYPISHYGWRLVADERSLPAASRRSSQR